MRLSTVTLILVLAAPALFADDACVPYNYCETWSGMCATGTQQSPIANNASDRRADPRLGNLVRYPVNLVTGVTAKNTGTSLKSTTARRVQTNYNGAPITLEEFHFHTPAEHRIDVWIDARHPPVAMAELHLVHRNAAGKVIVVAVPIRLGPSNPALAALMALGTIPTCQSRTSPTDAVPMAALLPAVTGRYITYEGSLTTPACDQGVTFLLMNDGITATQAQLNYIKIVCNARPVQFNPNPVTFRVAQPGD